MKVRCSTTEPPGRRRKHRILADVTTRSGPSTSDVPNSPGAFRACGRFVFDMRAFSNTNCDRVVFSRLVRRTHMYLALFLAPWMLGYALSTIAMNHRMPRPVTFVTESAQHYPNTFEPGTPPREIAQQILMDLKLDGAFGVQGPAPDGRITINRQGMLSPRRITFTP